MIIRQHVQGLRNTRSQLRAAFTTLSVSHATRLLNHAGVDIENQANTAKWKSGSWPKKSRFSPRFRLHVDRVKRAVVFETQELIGFETEDKGPSATDTHASAGFSNGRRRSTVLEYGHQVLPETLFEGINRSLRFNTDSTQKLQLKFSLDSLWRSFKRFDAEEISFTINNYHDDVRFTLISMAVDTDALKRQPEISSIPKIDVRSELEQRAEEDGLIYHELDGNIGCVVNGAGLAMATNDILKHYGGKAANFLDTGGQATTDLLVKTFALLLSDERIKAIWVNIFGGLIRCDMIAESIIRAATELDMKNIPIVVRLRGTNQELGQKMIAESGLDFIALSEVDEAAKKVIELAATSPSNEPQLPQMSNDTASNALNSSTAVKEESPDTLQHFAISGDTRVIYQGFTGGVATSNAKATIGYGTNVVGGVSPGKGGSNHLDLPVYNTVKEAVDHLKPDASAIFVPAFKAKAAILEAIDAKIPIIVSVAEGIPIHDALQIHEALRASQHSRLIGPNCPGLINPAGKCRLGIMPHAQFTPGCIGIISKSGTLSYETVAETTKHGLGQSLVLGIGGDLLPGTTMVEALAAILPRSDTKGVILLGEIGGNMEIEAAEWLKQNNKDGKPVVGLIAGHTAPSDKVMGHAGALRRRDDLTAAVKEAALRSAGVEIVAHTGELGLRMSELLSQER